MRRALLGFILTYNVYMSFHNVLDNDILRTGGIEGGKKDKRAQIKKNFEQFETGRLKQKVGRGDTSETIMEKINALDNTDQRTCSEQAEGCST